MPEPPANAIPIELEHRLRPGEPVLRWDRRARVPWFEDAGRLLGPLGLIALATGSAIVFVPGAHWQTPVRVVFSAAIAFSGVSFSATFLTIAVRQRRQTLYAITRERALVISGFWAQGTRAWLLADVTGVDLQAHADGTGTIWFGGRNEPPAPQFRCVADAGKTCDLLREATRRATMGR